jgi:hypothetical protein
MRLTIVCMERVRPVQISLKAAIVLMLAASVILLIHVCGSRGLIIVTNVLLSALSFCASIGFMEAARQEKVDESRVREVVVTVGLFAMVGVLNLLRTILVL